MSVDHEILERLLIDRALGEMSADIEALLEDYLAREPLMGDQADEIAHTIELARHHLAPIAAWRGRGRYFFGTKLKRGHSRLGRFVHQSNERTSRFPVENVHWKHPLVPRFQRAERYGSYKL